ncbi:GNAT family N-acetyltransferase [Paenibacillus sp. D2_2]|uniref:GNAT family N-acetyltransferase n=1 Tax=Paenibacillus sp. D2_2 TaxID=3073092 RepID=UPI002814EBBD|nr:GNAT family N-acetyltransferase [Paenibacillus sp. D2_2]WMT41437.1 GNAT family N-acetyltransferase [Paenibacillus sp. D2_2]
MLKYYRGTEQDMKVLFTAFQAGFVDYMVKLDLTEEQFAAHFFGQEGNALEHSFVALYGGEAVGIILGGIKEYEGIRTMRCGALAIRPDLRGQGVSKELFRLHHQEAVEQGCRQLYLEVIKGNERAIAFYNHVGYQQLYDLAYYTLADVSGLMTLPHMDESGRDRPSIVQINNEQFIEAVQGREYFHMNWQNDLDYISRSNKYVYYGAMMNGKLVAVMAITRQGRISLLVVDKNERGHGVAQLLLNNAIHELALTRLQISFSNNAGVHGFLQHLRFQKDPIQQYEMYRFI